MQLCWSGFRPALPVRVQIYRNFEIGKLIKLIMLDTRVIGAPAQLQPT
jgi:phosphodiesterase/alkaline phosphatase D-like protein